jgi:starch-binding outer membrane protein, SusD/RagB family
MKSDMKNILKFGLLTFALLFSWSCTDLEEQILDESLVGGCFGKQPGKK